jgi:hypothetical protein
LSGNRRSVSDEALMVREVRVEVNDSSRPRARRGVWDKDLQARLVAEPVGQNPPNARGVGREPLLAEALLPKGPRQEADTSLLREEADGDPGAVEEPVLIRPGHDGVHMRCPPDDVPLRRDLKGSVRGAETVQKAAAKHACGTVPRVLFENSSNGRAAFKVEVDLEAAFGKRALPFPLRDLSVILGEMEQARDNVRIIARPDTVQQSKWALEPESEPADLIYHIP